MTMHEHLGGTRARRARHGSGRAGMNAHEPDVEVRDGERARGERGYFIALTALLLLPMLAFTGFATDLGAWYARAAAMQRASDAAALAGVAHLPDQGAAIAAARRVAAQNGFEQSDTVDVTIEPRGQRLRVDIADAEVSQYFTSIFRDDVGVERGATAEYVLPVSLGSARNYLGSGTLVNASGVNAITGVSGGNSARDNFWLSVNGPCSSAEQGDLLLPISTGNFSGGSWRGCFGSTITDRRGGADPYWDDSGYYYAVKVPADYPASAGPIRVQVFDASRCDGIAGENKDIGTFTTQFDLRSWDTTPWDPKDNDEIISTRSFASRSACTSSHSDCATGTTPSATTNRTWHNRWCTLGTINAPKPGAIYFVQVRTFTPGGDLSNTPQQYINNFSLRAATGSSGFAACTTDEFDPNIASTATDRERCPQMYAANFLSIYANVAATPVFYLANIEKEHSNKNMTVWLFDAGEGIASMELLNPLYTTNASQSPVTFDWEVIRQASDDVAPTGGWSGRTSKLDTLGTSRSDDSAKCGTNNAQRGPNRLSGQKYNDRLLQLKYDLPTDIQAAYNGRTWWRIRYATKTGCASQDRTTWSVTITGDPVRLVE